MKTGIRFLILWFCISFSTNGNGQVICGECGSEDILNQKTDTIVIRDTMRIYISRLDDVTRTFGMTFDEFAKAFLLRKAKMDFSGEIPPQTVYLNYLLPLWQGQKELGAKRFVSHVFTFYPDKSPSLESLDVSDSLEVKNFDLVFTCGGELLTNHLITSPSLRNAALVELFRHIDAFNSNVENNRKIGGINFYFPEYQFREKRAMAQFAKSVSLILDSTHVQSIRNLSFYFSFDKTSGLKNRTYLYALSGMADSLFLLENNGINPAGILTRKDAVDLSIGAKIVNQFYLARFFLKKFPAFKSPFFSATQVNVLAEADYPDNNWESYLFALICLLTLLPVLFVLYWTVPEFAFYLERNKDYAFVLIIMFVLEILLLLLAMIEAMSKEDILNLSGNNRNVLLLLPLLLVFAIPVFKAMGNKTEKP